MTVVLTLLTPPPSVNSIYRNVPGKGRRKTKAYRKWREDAVLWLRLQKPPAFTEQVSVSIELPLSTRGDADNRNKAALDALQEAGVVANDRLCDPVTIGRFGVSMTTITITPASEAATLRAAE